MPPNSPAHNAKKPAKYCQPPSRQGLPIEFWDVPYLAEWVHDHFEVLYTYPLRPQGLGKVVVSGVWLGVMGAWSLWILG